MMVGLALILFLLSVPLWGFLFESLGFIESDEARDFRDAEGRKVD